MRFQNYNISDYSHFKISKFSISVFQILKIPDFKNSKISTFLRDLARPKLHKCHFTIFLRYAIMLDFLHFEISHLIPNNTNIDCIIHFRQSCTFMLMVKGLIISPFNIKIFQTIIERRRWYYWADNIAFKICTNDNNGNTHFLETCI